MTIESTNPADGTLLRGFEAMDCATVTARLEKHASNAPACALAIEALFGMRRRRTACLRPC